MAGRDMLVFTDAVGRPLRGAFVNHAFHRILDAAGLPSIPFHGLRHSAATAMLAAGVPLKTVSDHLGHSTIVITADKYAGVTADLRREAADAMDRALGGASCGKVRRGPGVSEATHRKVVDGFAKRQAAESARRAGDAARRGDAGAAVAAAYASAVEAGIDTTPDAIGRRAMDDALEEAEVARSRRQLSNARDLVRAARRSEQISVRPEPLHRAATFDECEREREDLARQGLPHGYGAIARADGPFPGQESTVKRRYKQRRLPPPGVPIDGICDSVPAHQHWTFDHPLTTRHRLT